MPFLALGVEHRTAPLAIRESVAMDEDALVQAGVDLHAIPAVDEVAILCTCNRTEIYLFAEEVAEATAAAAAYLIRAGNHIAPCLRTWDEMEAVEHLFRVACGLESQALGEPQVLSQVRETLDLAQTAGTIGPNLHALFRSAISCARQARAGTALGRVESSLGTQAVQAAEKEIGSLAGRAALVIGAGEISRLIVEELRRRSIGELYVANRTEALAVELARAHGATPVRLEDLPRVLPRVDLVLTATSAPRYVLTAEDFAAMSRGGTPPRDTIGRDLLRRHPLGPAGYPHTDIVAGLLRGPAQEVPTGDRVECDGCASPEHKSASHSSRPLLIFDLAVPRDVEPAVGAIAGITLRDLDSFLPAGLEEHWREDIQAMEAAIAAEVHEFTAWYLTRRVVPVISSLRSHVEAVSEQELRRVAPQLRDLTDRERAAVESLTQRLIDKMFHHLVMRLRLAAQTDPKLVEAAEFFFLHGEGGLFEHAAEGNQFSVLSSQLETDNRESRTDNR